MKLYSWNVNGIRAVAKKGFLDWFEAVAADVVCVQETKAKPEQLDESVLHPLGYESYFHSAQKPGYSGVATFCKKEPLDIKTGIGDAAVDDEGRVLTTEHKDFFMVNTYFPNSQREGARLGYKLEFCEKILRFCEGLKKSGKGVILCGDYNIAHQAIDLRNPKANEDCAGFLPEERAWMTKFLSSGYRDLFRESEPGGGHYTWWSYRAGVREKNIGWRLDYHCANAEFGDHVNEVGHQPMVLGSDHCPVYIYLKD